MKNDQTKTNSYLKQVDRMINEGLGNGTIVSKYNEAHSELKEKEELIKQKHEEQRDDKK